MMVIRDNIIDAQQLVSGKEHAAVHDADLVFVLVAVHVLADFSQSAQGVDQGIRFPHGIVLTGGDIGFHIIVFVILVFSHCESFLTLRSAHYTTGDCCRLPGDRDVAARYRNTAGMETDCGGSRPG